MLLLLEKTMATSLYHLPCYKPKNKETGEISSTRVIPMEREALLSGSTMPTQVSMPESPPIKTAMKVSETPQQLNSTDGTT